MAVSWLRWLVTGLSQWRPRFTLESVSQSSAASTGRETKAKDCSYFEGIEQAQGQFIRR
jgi:hypothetical protein